MGHLQGCGRVGECMPPELKRQVAARVQGWLYKWLVLEEQRASSLATSISAL